MTPRSSKHRTRLMSNGGHWRKYRRRCLVSKQESSKRIRFVCQRGIHVVHFSRQHFRSFRANYVWGDKPMIEGKCVCGKSFSEPESVINQPTACRKCNAVFTAVSAEALAEGAGAGDFDALLIVRKGPSRVGEQFFLGG